MGTVFLVEPSCLASGCEDWSKSLNGMDECVFKKCCEKYKKKGKHCKKCPKK
jgi:hypothetical protein